jgi:beta-N-acetylhexosaminidase
MSGAPTIEGDIGEPVVEEQHPVAERRDVTDAVVGSLMLAFDGLELPADVAERLASAPAAGVTLFRFSNVADPGQIRSLTAAIQAAAAGERGTDTGARGLGVDLPVLIAADQEGGQLIGLGDGTTPFAGNMALGAAGDPALAERAWRAMGLELRALGVTVDYSPVCDLATNPANPAIGIRSFGDDPGAVGELVAAAVRGLQSAGVAAALKHFPGIGDVAADSHHELPLLAADRGELHSRELAPFRAGIDAGARIVMSAHLAVPALTGDPQLPSTLAPAVMDELLRGELGFDGVSITDALDMRALAQGSNQVLDVLAALRAGVDLLLTAPDPEARARIEAGLRHAAARGLIDAASARASARRIRALREWLAGFDQPELAVVGSAAHAALANDLAARALTLVRDDEGLIPIALDPTDRIAAIMPTPTDQTPADTSSTVKAGLAAALNHHHPAVHEIIVAHAPSADEIAAVLESVRDHSLVVVGTTAAYSERGQTALVEALLAARQPVITVALRTPFDLAAYPASRVHASSYGLLRPSLEALGAALFGRAGFPGRLPAAIPGLYPTGFGLVR